MSRELWSQSGEPTWAIDERLRRLEARVNQLAEVVAELVLARQNGSMVGYSGRELGVGQPCQSHRVAGDGGDGTGGAS